MRTDSAYALEQSPKRKDGLIRPITSHSNTRSNSRPATSATARLTSKMLIENLYENTIENNDNNLWSSSAASIKRPKTVHGFVTEDDYDEMDFVVDGIMRTLPVIQKQDTKSKLREIKRPERITVEEVVNKRKIISDSPLLDPVRAPPSSMTVSRSFQERDLRNSRPHTVSSPNLGRNVMRPHEVQSPVRNTIRSKPSLNGVLSPPLPPPPRPRSTSPENSISPTPSPKNARPDSPVKKDFFNENVSTKPKVLADLENFINNELREISRE
jgi:hypothetical protein